MIGKCSKPMTTVGRLSQGLHIASAPRIRTSQESDVASRLFAVERSPANRRIGCLLRWLADPFAQELLALFGALTTLSLGPAEEFGELLVFGALRVLDVDLQPQDVAQALLQKPDGVVVLVGGPRDSACLGVF
jgi:hypothetical protein